MSAAMDLHLALCLGRAHDAREAYRLAHAYRDEELSKAAEAAGKVTDGAQAPTGETAQPAVGTCGRALATGQPCPDHPVVPRTEREYWVDIANALNAAAAAGMPVGIDIEGILTDYNAWAVVWNPKADRWEVGGYEDNVDEAALITDTNDWVVCSSPDPRCPAGELKDRAVGRGWTSEGRAAWLCAEHSPRGFFRPGRTYAHANYRFECLHHVTHPVTGEVQAWGWFGKADTDGRRHMSFTRGQWEARPWDDITDGEVSRG